MNLLKEIENDVNNGVRDVVGMFKGAKAGNAAKNAVAPILDEVTSTTSDVLVNALAAETGIEPTPSGLASLFSTVINGQKNISPLGKALLDTYQTSQLAGTNAGLATAVTQLVSLVSPQSAPVPQSASVPQPASSAPPQAEVPPAPASSPAPSAAVGAAIAASSDRAAPAFTVGEEVAIASRSGQTAVIAALNADGSVEVENATSGVPFTVAASDLSPSSAPLGGVIG